MLNNTKEKRLRKYENKILDDMYINTIDIASKKGFMKVFEDFIKSLKFQKF